MQPDTQQSASIPCPKCNGTGQDAEATRQARKAGYCDSQAYMRCWNCHGNGLDPAAYFSWN
jgi:DnaJ-class molecular chaperone